MVVLEVPRENALFLMQNSQNLQLTVPTQNAPTWMVKELQAYMDLDESNPYPFTSIIRMI
jgi:hypothetical protein